MKFLNQNDMTQFYPRLGSKLFVLFSLYTFENNQPTEHPDLGGNINRFRALNIRPLVVV